MTMNFSILASTWHEDFEWWSVVILSTENPFSKLFLQNFFNCQPSSKFMLLRFRQTKHKVLNFAKKMPSLL